MSGKSHYISIGKEQLHFLKSGSGSRLLLAFHGYGDDAEQYDPMLEYLHNDYIILSFDLPYHGKSKWPDEVHFTKKKLGSMVSALMAEYQVDKVSLMGYSIGGRVALTILEYLPAHIDKVALIATDGLVVNPYFYFFTRTQIGKRIFRNMLEKPRNYTRVMDWLKARKWVDAARHKFASHFLQSEPGRKFLLKVWPAMNDIIPQPKKLKSLIHKYKIPVSIFMGAYDKIMPPSLAKKFGTGLDTVQLHILEKGHRVLDNENARQIAESLL
jgi:pimeloyl-ACP methyl ester carboxylesterase